MNNSLLYAGRIDSGKCTEFITRLLNGVTMAHMHHLMAQGQGSYARHKALEDLYTELSDLADTLAETLMGCCMDGVFKFSGGAVVIGSDAKTDIQALYDYVEQLRGCCGTESHIQNEIDNVCTLLSQTVYKLKNLS